MTDTELSNALATKSRLPSALRSISLGCSPTVISAMTVMLTGSITAIAWRPHSEAYSSVPSGCMAQAYAGDRRGRRSSGCKVRVLQRCSAESSRVHTYRCSPLRSSARPEGVMGLGQGWPSRMTVSRRRVSASMVSTSTALLVPAAAYRRLPSGLKARPYHSLGNVRSCSCTFFRVSNRRMCCRPTPLWVMANRLPSGDSTMFMGKSPRGICCPAGESVQPLGNSTFWLGCTPGWANKGHARIRKSGSRRIGSIFGKNRACNVS